MVTTELTLVLSHAFNILKLNGDTNVVCSTHCNRSCSDHIHPKISLWRVQFLRSIYTSATYPEGGGGGGTGVLMRAPSQQMDGHKLRHNSYNEYSGMVEYCKHHERDILYYAWNFTKVHDRELAVEVPSRAMCLPWVMFETSHGRTKFQSRCPQLIYTGTIL